MTDNKGNKREIIEPQIDPSVPWHEEHNMEAARELGLIYDPRSRVYRDTDGCLIRDRFGQPFG